MRQHTGHHSTSLLNSATGTCWYCNRHFNEDKRFCNNVCAEAFEEDETAMERRMLMNRCELLTETA